MDWAAVRDDLARKNPQFAGKSPEETAALYEAMVAERKLPRELFEVLEKLIEVEVDGESAVVSGGGRPMARLERRERGWVIVDLF